MSGVVVTHASASSPTAVYERERSHEVVELERALERVVDLVPAIRIGHSTSIYDRAQAMAVSTERLVRTTPRRGR